MREWGLGFSILAALAVAFIAHTTGRLRRLIRRNIQEGTRKDVCKHQHPLP